MSSTILVVGSANIDLVVRAPRLPRPGETVLGGDLLIVPGGKGANQAVGCARLGARVHLVARLGRDDFGDRALDNLSREGVGTEYVVRDDAAPTGVALVVVDGAGQNAIAVAPGANGRLSPQDVERAALAFRGADCVLVQLEVPLEAVRAAVEMGRGAGAKVILNPAPARPLPQDLLRQVDVLTPNLPEAALLAGRGGSPEELAQALLDRGVGAVALTLGEEGALFTADYGIHRISRLAVDVVDATAAGDAFNAALAVGLAGGMVLSRAVRFANAAAALACTRMGAQPSLPTLEELALLRGGPP